MLAVYLILPVNTVKLSVTCDQRGTVNTLYTLSLPTLSIPSGPSLFSSPPPLPQHSPPFMKAQCQPIRRDDDTAPPQAEETRAPCFFERQRSSQKAHSQTHCSTKGSHFHNWLPQLTLKRRPILLRLEAINNTA